MTVTDRISPARPRVAGRPQGTLLLLISCLPILGAVLLAPVLPTMQGHFEGTPGASALVPLTLSIPMLFVAVLAPFAGRVVDVFGRQRLLLTGLLTYAVFGTAPLWLDGLVPIVISRAGVGITEAAIMVCCTTLIADYFSGAERDRWLGLQTLTTAIAATLFFGAGGALGAVSWRAPFWLYASSLVFAVLAARMLFTPSAADGTGRSATAATGDSGRALLPPLPWQTLRGPVLVTLLGGVVFYTPVVELSYALDGDGVTSVGLIGAAAAVASAATAAGAFTFTRVGHLGPHRLLPVAFGLAGLGVAGMGLAPAAPLTVVAAVVASAGTGLMLPTLLTWAISGLAFEQRGRGTGLWTSALFLGEFVCPLLVLALAAATVGLSGALIAIGAVSLVFALAAAATWHAPVERSLTVV